MSRTEVAALTIGGLACLAVILYGIFAPMSEEELKEYALEKANR